MQLPIPILACPGSIPGWLIIIACIVLSGQVFVLIASIILLTGSISAKEPEKRSRIRKRANLCTAVAIFHFIGNLLLIRLPLSGAEIASIFYMLLPLIFATTARSLAKPNAPTLHNQALE